MDKLLILVFYYLTKQIGLVQRDIGAFSQSTANETA